MRYLLFDVRSNPDIDRPLRHISKKKMDELLADGNARRISQIAIQLVDSTRVVLVPPEPVDSIWKQTKAYLAASSCGNAGLCEICGFDRAIERAHIIPARYDGPADPLNLMELCPNHHTLFDSDMLTWDEMQKIWPRVFPALMARMHDSRLDSWRERLVLRYGISFNPS